LTYLLKAASVSPMLLIAFEDGLAAKGIVFQKSFQPGQIL
jgi:hypothetical protein